jgi:hypothetical protein
MTTSRLRLLILLFGTGLILVNPVFAQSVCSDQEGKTKPLDPTIRLCIESREGPNLRLGESTRLTGILRYENCDPVKDNEVRVRISDPTTKKALYWSTLDSLGQFEFPSIAAGEYLISAELRGHGVYWRLAVVGQSQDLSCTRGSECRLEVMIWWKPTKYKLTYCSQNRETHENHATQK